MQRMSSAYIIDGNVRKTIVIDHNNMAAVCLISGKALLFFITVMDFIDRQCYFVI